MQNRMDDADNEVRFGAINSFSSFDFAAEIGDRLKPLLADDESISVSLAASDYLVHSGEGRYPGGLFFAQGVELAPGFGRLPAVFFEHVLIVPYGVNYVEEGDAIGLPLVGVAVQTAG